jgi:hypothetical protein
MLRSIATFLISVLNVLTPLAAGGPLAADVRQEAAAKTDARRPRASKQPVSGFIVDPGMVTPEQRKQRGINAVAIVLDGAHAAEAYAPAAKAVAAQSLELYYWIEVARNPAMARDHPRWMASLGTHPDWQRSFPSARLPGKGEVAKAFPWVPITYRESYDAHLARIKLLLAKASGPFAGVLLNDLQGGPASCGCGNLQCRWATDYGVPSTATRLEGDDVAARFVAEVRALAPGKPVIPVWTTECEDIDLPEKLAAGGKSTGLSGGVECANKSCPKAFTTQLSALLAHCDGPVGVLALQSELERDAAHGHPADFAPRAMNYLATVPPNNGGKAIERERLWLVIQGHGSPPEKQLMAYQAAAKLGAGAVFQSLVPLEQSYEPRLLK